VNPAVTRLFAAVPLRVKLVALILALVSAALLVIGVFSAVEMRQYLLDRVDTQLRGAASVLSRPQANLVLTPDYLGANGVVGPDGTVHWDLKVASKWRDDLPPMPADSSLDNLAGKPYTVRALGSIQRWRVLVTQLDGGGYVLIAENLAETDRAINRLIIVELILGPGVLMILAAVGVSIVRASLQPLREIEHAAAAIAAGDLTRRVPEYEHESEIGRLSRALNTMLTQIEGAFTARAASEERMRQFIADASHELRTPLTTIRGFAELYRQGAAREPEQTAALIKRIEDEAARMGLLVEDLLLLARLDRERPLSFAPVELPVIASDAVTAARAVAPDRTITLEVDRDTPLAVLGDESRLRQIVSNLMTNALTHTPPGSPVVVRVFAEPPYATLEVIDAGPGLTEEQAARVFERFYRVDKARTRQAAINGASNVAHSGTGLGLAIVAALVAAHGGSVSIDSASALRAVGSEAVGSPAAGPVPDDAPRPGSSVPEDAVYRRPAEAADAGGVAVAVTDAPGPAAPAEAEALPVPAPGSKSTNGHGAVFRVRLPLMSEKS
jgi:two-component system OmpR family sensor kinase